jgi:hypothetical protein
MHSSLIAAISQLACQNNYLAEFDNYFKYEIFTEQVKKSGSQEVASFLDGPLARMARVQLTIIKRLAPAAGLEACRRATRDICFESEHRFSRR